MHHNRPLKPLHSPREAGLPLGRVSRLRLQVGDTVVVRQGGLWLTRSGDGQDYFLRPGISFVATRRETVLIEGIAPQPAQFAVEPARIKPQPSRSGWWFA
jgi:hypothetical protein